MQISLKIIRSINHAKSTICIKFQLLVTFSSLFTGSSSLSVFPRGVLYRTRKKRNKNIYSTLGGKTDKLDEAVNRELNVTRSWNFVQTVDLAWFIAWMSFKLICILDLPEFFLLSLKSLSSGGSPYYWMCWKRLWAWESATDEKSATAPPIYVARHFRFGQTRPNLSILLHIIYMRTLETSLSCKCSIYVLV